MNISHESSGDLNAILTLVIEESDYKDKVEQELKNYRKNANMPGFRQGKVPMSMIKKMYEESLKANIVSQIVGDELDKYIKEKDLKLFGQPLPNKEKQEMLDFRNDKDFTLYYDIAFVPKINLELDKKRKIDFLNIEATDEDVDKYLNEIRSKNGKRTNPEDVNEGDVVFGTIQELDENNEIKENGIEKDTSIHVDFIKLKTIKDKFLKLNIDDTVDFNPKRSFKNDTELASLLDISKEEAEEMKSDFRFTLKEVSRIEPAEMNEELFSQIYPGQEIKSEEELISKIKEDIEKTYEAESNKFFFNQVTQQLVNEADIELPDEFLKRWIMEKNMDEENQESKITQEQLDEQYPSYKDNLKWQIIEEKLAEDNELKVTHDDLKNQVKKWIGAQMPGAAEDDKTDDILNTVMESVMQNEEEVRKLSSQIMEDKFTNLFKEKFELNEKSTSYDDFVETAQKFYQDK
jgi:trigger factor